MALLDRVRREGWDGVAGLTLLREAERVIRPLVRNVARRHGVAAEELSNAALTAAWAALRRYDARQSPDPRGWLALVARRAAVDEALMARTGHAARNRARLAAAVAAARQALSDELGRSPAPVEVRARLSRSMRAEADRCEAAAHLDAFIGIAAAEPVDLDADAVAGLTPRGTDRGCPRLGAVARAIAEEQRIQPARAQGAAELAADLAADLIPTLGVDETRRLVAAELARSPLSVRLPRPAGQRLFDAIMTALGDGAGRPPSAA